MIRKATYNDLTAIRELPVQLAARPVAGIKYKHWRVLVLEARTHALVYQRRKQVNAFIALRKTDNYLEIVHLGLQKPFFYNRVAAELAGFAVRQALEQNCCALFVNATGLTSTAIAWYKANGYVMQEGQLVNSLNFRSA